MVGMLQQALFLDRLFIMPVAVEAVLIMVVHKGLAEIHQSHQLKVALQMELQMALLLMRLQIQVVVLVVVLVVLVMESAAQAVLAL